MRAVVGRLAVVCAVLAVGARARADGGALLGPAHDPLSTPSRVGLESDFVAFDIDGQRGSFLTVAPLLEWSPIAGASLRVRVPVETLFLSGEDTRAGIGDVELRAKFRLFAVDGDRILVYGGFDEQLPTGASHLGLGGGDIQLTSFLTGGYKSGPIIVYLTVGDVLAIHPSSFQPPVDYIDPSSDHELREDLGVFWDPAKALRLTAALSGVTVLVPSDFGQSLLSAGAGVVYAPTRAWKLSLVVDLPIAGERRFDEKVSLGLYRYF